MKKTTKVFLYIAIGLIVAGIICVAVAMFSMNFNFEQINNQYSKEIIYEENIDFYHISIKDTEYNIKILPSENDKCKIVSTVLPHIYHIVESDVDKLSIIRKDTRKWYEKIGFTNNECTLTVYLPKGNYGNVYIESASGELDVSGDFTFRNIDFNTASGNVNFSCIAEKSIEISTVSGEIELENFSCDDLKLQSTSGDILCSKSNTVGKILVKSVSGEVELADIVSTKKLTVQTTSGDIELDHCDFSELDIKSTSGEIDASLLTHKVFDIKTTSGEINVPASKGNEKCKIVTTSGDITFKIADK